VRPAIALLTGVLLISGCGLPHDADGTLERVRGGVLRVGAIENHPWVIDRGDTFEGIDGELVAAIAASVGARIDWVRMPEFELIDALRRRELDLVVGGFHTKLPWAKDIAFTRPYFKGDDGKAHVLAAPPGENAWLLHVDREIERHKPELRLTLTRSPS
jgi:polar amino acid transport system substrate-binding protein